MSTTIVFFLRRVDQKLVGLARRTEIPLLRLGLAVVYLWFGTIKLIPGGSPIQQMVERTVSALTFNVVTGTPARIMAGVTEVVVGLVLITMRLPRVTAFLLLMHVALTSSPLVLFADEMWTGFMLPTLECQYIIKNTITVGAAAVIAATALLGARSTRHDSHSLPTPRVERDVPSHRRISS